MACHCCCVRLQDTQDTPNSTINRMIGSIPIMVINYKSLTVVDSNYLSINLGGYLSINCYKSH